MSGPESTYSYIFFLGSMLLCLAFEISSSFVDGTVDGADETFDDIIPV